MNLPNQLNPQTVDRLNKLTVQVAPLLAEISKILRDNGLHDFEVNVDGKNSFYWSGGLETKRSPSQQELEEELTNILNEAYPRNIISFLGMIYNPNRNVAQAMARVVAMHRAKDRREVAGQIVALLAAFQQGS